MANAFDHSNGAAPRKAGALDWRKKMSDTIAYALLVYTGLQIFVTMQALHADRADRCCPILR